ncbi:hypothetical protein [Streptomyces exfoliatus]|uniref:hypothetical protein n=1 Tax=Streptomyces exfoliatus TaxID=1905 RepID=UPI003C2B2335
MPRPSSPPGPLPDVGCFITVVGVPAVPHVDGTADPNCGHGVEVRGFVAPRVGSGAGRHDGRNLVWT